VEMEKGGMKWDFIFDPMGVLLEQVLVEGEC
jgi:hypothetical protein